MSATAVQFGDLQLQDDVYVIPGRGRTPVRGIVTGLGPNKELTLNATLNFGTDDGYSFIVLEED